MKKILCIDDSKTVRQQVSMTLSRGGEYQVLEAGNGEEGITQLQSHPDVAAVVCDVNMPGMTGIDFLAKIKTEAAFQGLPVVMLTTESSDAKIAEAKSHGARAWLVKPFDPAKLIAVIGKIAK